VGIVCLCHNLLKLYQVGGSAKGLGGVEHAPTKGTARDSTLATASNASVQSVTAGEPEGSGRAPLERDPSRRSAVERCALAQCSTGS